MSLHHVTYLYATPEPERSGPDPFLDGGLTSSRHTLTERKKIIK